MNMRRKKHDEKDKSCLKAINGPVSHLRYENEGRAVAEAIKKGTCTAVNDGSYQPQFGTSATIVKDMEIQDQRWLD